jgi:hypothetical protein
LLHLVLDFLSLEAIDELQNMPSIHIFSDNIDRFFKGGGEFDAGSAFGGLFCDFADLDIIVRHVFDFLWNNM